MEGTAPPLCASLGSPHESVSSWSSDCISLLSTSWDNDWKELESDWNWGRKTVPRDAPGSVSLTSHWSCLDRFPFPTNFWWGTQDFWLAWDDLRKETEALKQWTLHLTRECLVASVIPLVTHPALTSPAVPGFILMWHTCVNLTVGLLPVFNAFSSAGWMCRPNFPSI